jgi:O-methyltransferase
MGADSGFNLHKGLVAPPQSFKWLRPFIPRRLQPWLRGQRKRWQLRNLKLDEPYRTVYPYCQASRYRQQNLLRLGAAVDLDRVDGAVVECGVLDGGTGALMAFATSASGRPIHLFDAWQGLPETVEQDGAEGRQWVGEVVGSPARVLEVMNRLEIPRSRITLHRGWFHETFPGAQIPRIALLHIDCDFYEPTKLCLERWFVHVAPGGYVQFDDYMMFQGCTLAVDEFLAAHPELTLEILGEVGRGEAYYIRKGL